MNEQPDRQPSGAEAQDPVSFPDRMSTYPVLPDLCLERLLGIQILDGHIACPEGSVLFAERQKVLGLCVLRDGRVKISVGSDIGKSLITRSKGCCPSGLA